MTEHVPTTSRGEIEADPGRPCPFCPGHEDPTLTPLDSVEHGDRWQMRVIPNLYPAFDGTAGFVVHHLGPVHVTADASGIHEVFVYTPNHDGGLDELDDKGAADLMRVLQRRLAAHAAAPEVRYTQVIINHGREAGASLLEMMAGRRLAGVRRLPCSLVIRDSCGAQRRREREER